MLKTKGGKVLSKVHYVTVIRGEGTIDITENGEHDVSKYAKANVNIPLPEIKDGNFIDIVSLPTSDIIDDATYRVLNGAFFDGKKFRNNAFCRVVEWGKKPSILGEDAFQDKDGETINISYYDAIDGTMWLYFGNSSRRVLSNMVDAREDLSSLEKIAAKAILNGLSGWKNKDELMSLVGDKISLPGGKEIYSLDEVTDVDEEYLYLYKEMFVYENGEWINLDGTEEYEKGLIDKINSTVDEIIVMQESLIGGDGE